MAPWPRYSSAASTAPSWLPQCPRRDADAVCRGAYEGEFDTWHYGRNEGQLASLAEECEAGGGQWEEFE